MPQGQEQERPYGYEDQTAHHDTDEASPEEEVDEEEVEEVEKASKPMNAYEFILALLKWVGKHWVFVLFFGHYVLYPILHDLLQLLMHIVIGK
jgi:hypothetical protein